MLRDVFYGSCMRSFGINNLELLLSNDFVKKNASLLLTPCNPSPDTSTHLPPEFGFVRGHGKSLKISIYLHCLILPNFNDPWLLSVAFFSRPVWLPHWMLLSPSAAGRKQLQQRSWPTISGCQIHPDFCSTVNRGRVAKGLLERKGYVWEFP